MLPEALAAKEAGRAALDEADNWRPSLEANVRAMETTRVLDREQRWQRLLKSRIFVTCR